MTHSEHGELKVVTVNLPVADLYYIDKLLKFGHSASRSEYFRRAVKNQIENDRITMRYQQKIINEEMKIYVPIINRRLE